MGGVVPDKRVRRLVVRRGYELGRRRWSVPGRRVEPGEADEVAVQREVAVLRRASEGAGLDAALVRQVGSV